MQLSFLFFSSHQCFTLTDSWAKLLCQASKELLLGDGKMKERGMELWQCFLLRSRCVSVCVWEKLLLAALHVIATDPKVTDHPNCVFTHSIINHRADQQWLDCSYGAEGLDGYQYTMFLPSLCQILPLGLDTLFSGAYGFWIPVVKTRRPFPCVKRASSRVASAPPHSHSPQFGQSCKAGPWESPASTLIHSAQLCSRGCPASSFIPATTHPGRAKPDWQSPAASRASVSFPPVAAHHPSRLFNLRSN